LLFFFGFATYALLFGPPVFPMDDAYIVQHNARVLHLGFDPNFSAPALTGSTSALHTVSVAVLMFVLPGLWAQSLVGWIAVGVYAAGLLRLARVYGLTGWKALAAVVLGLLVGDTPHHLLNGLETGLALAAVTWSIALLGELRPRRGIPIIAGLLPVIRPELVVLSVSLLAVQATRRRRSGAPEWRRHVLADAGLCALVAAPWLCANVFLAGGVLPNTIAAKSAFFAEGHAPAGERLATVSAGFIRFGRALGIAAAAIPLLLTRPAGRVGVLLCAVMAAAYWSVFPGALQHYESRYLYVLVPFVILAVVLAQQHQTFRGIYRLILPLALLNALYCAPGRWRAHLDQVDFTTGSLAPTAAWVRENVPAHATVLVHDAGYIAFATDLRLVDLVGLKTPSSIKVHAQYTAPSGGARRLEAVRAIARTADADFAVVLSEWDQIFRLTDGLDSPRLVWRSKQKGRYYSVYRLSSSAQ